MRDFVTRSLARLLTWSTQSLIVGNDYCSLWNYVAEQLLLLPLMLNLNVISIKGNDLTGAIVYAFERQEEVVIIRTTESYCIIGCNSCTV